MATQRDNSSGDEVGAHDSSWSWRTMLLVLGVSILIAAGLAYLLVYPFFHQHAR